jgi:hypothetical protein
VAPPAGAVPARLVGSDIYGQQRTVGGIALRPDVAQSTGALFVRHWPCGRPAARTR